MLVDNLMKLITLVGQDSPILMSICLEFFGTNSIKDNHYKYFLVMSSMIYFERYKEGFFSEALHVQFVLVDKVD